MLITAPLSLLLGLVFAPLGETTLTSEIVPEFVHWQENADDLEQRLARLTVELEDQLESAHIVGMAIAIVKGDEVVYSQGFGLADRESGREVTPETIFAIGSSTKAFTSATIATLVDEGKMDWEDPVTEYLPDFELQIDAEGMSAEEAVVTLRDLMSHRTGFTRMGVLWAAGLADREMILETAIDAQPWSPFRKKFFYNNVMFLAAGEASAVAADQSWDELVTARILEPLGMSSSNTTTEEAQADERLALGYKWDEDKEVFVRDQMRVLNSIAPAGSINSNVLDMAQWLRLQLGRGEVDGKRLISTERLEQTWAPNIEVGGGMEYGMGWFIESWNGKRVIQHGGNIDGFAATCAFMPDDDLGFVLLSNVGMSTLQDASRSIVWDALLGSLGEAELEGDSAPAEDLTPFVGTYMANFGSFHDEAFEILVQDGHLALDIPSQQVFELLALGEDGRRDFALAPGVMAVSFLRGDDDEVTNIVLHQSGLSFEAPREGFVPEPDGTMQEFSRYFGTYEHPELPQPITVRYSGGRLECDIPGQMVFPMRLPNEEGIWHFRATDMIGLKFNEDEDGEVTSVT
ncbi:MAG: CubicO group peptidase (beta-lactamase class C family), partial [Planctomycetota bacterium]